ncbi:MAG TPA: LysM peptidoglycan-binding domain-containing protein [Candidatus Saccharimonadales bacterium]
MQRKVARYGLLAVNVIMLGAIVAFVLWASPSSTSSHSGIANASATAANDPLDQLSSADIAVNLAQMTNLPETTAVINQADSVGAQLSVPVAQTTVISKPQAVTTDLKSNKDIIAYTVKQGDTVASIAAQFNVTSDSIKWSNGLSNDAVNAGAKLYIPPVNGIVYAVKAGDTVDSLATKYRASKDQVVAYNDAEINGIWPGELVIIPNGQQPAPVVAYSYYGLGSFAATYAASGGYNGYDYGFCTWYVANKRSQIGNPVPSNLGNASTWDSRAMAAGLPVDHHPSYGAAVVTAHLGAGHVAFVEQVNDDGSVWVSEMNSHGQVSITNPAPAGGWGRVDFKLWSADAAAGFWYIH